MTKVARVWKALFGSTESRPKVFVEPLESRQLLSGLGADGINAIPTITSLSSVPAVAMSGQPYTLTAKVVLADQSGEQPTGTVAFLSVDPYNGDVAWANPGARTGGSARIIGTSPLADDGTATLTRTAGEYQWPWHGTHQYVAVYLGHTLTIAAGKFGGRVAVSLPGQPASLPFPSSSSPASTRAVFTGGSPFYVAGRTVSILDEAPPDAVQLSPGHWTSVYSGTSFISSAAFASVTVERDHTSVWAVEAPAALAELWSPLFETSCASIDLRTVAQPKETTLVMRTLGRGTRTNPPVITFGFNNSAGGQITYADYPAERGTYRSSTASVIVSIPSSTPPGSGGGSGDGSLGAVKTFPRLNLPTGSITLYDGDVYLTTVSLQEGKATFAPASNSLDFGIHNIRAVYSGDELYQPSSADVAIEIAMTPTKTVLSYPAGPVVQGGTVPLSAKVTTTVKELVTPTGPVRFYVDGTLYATVPLGVTEQVTWDLPVGTHQIHAVYEGNADQLGSTSDPVALEVAAATTTPNEPAAPEVTPLASEPVTPPISVPLVPPTSEPVTLPVSEPVTLPISEPVVLPTTASTTQVSAAATTVVRRGILRLPVAVRADANTHKPRGWVTVLLNGKAVARKRSGGLLKLPSRLTRRSYVLELVYSGDDQTLASRSRYILRVGAKALRLVPADRK